MKETKRKTQEDKRALVLQKALELFADKGFHSTTTAEIAKAAGIAKGSLFNYFENKEQLLRTIVFDTMLQMAELIDPNHDGVVTEEEFFGMIRNTFEWVGKKREFLLLYFSIVSQPTVYNLLCAELWEILDPYLKQLGAFFRQSGFEDPETEVRYFLAMLDGMSINYAMDPGNFPIEKIEKKITLYYKYQLQEINQEH
ncbi:TetR/AcrR family transcriptional regulator [Marinilabilia rubra]|uniref:TetR/AcrR family transcriptional regulator n=1 Tax=Marinilabilia rubra TaxID=2162893 RepID=A0A2U2B9D2_9BACT|nr:TetR/AcrR family transcriptional regulator [Marinilabilia rubra]PWD99675.1 TetR/AcrR family transcriptional regulator [Marinilabilia rubra]